MASADIHWYYRKGRHEFGPVDHAALESLHESGLLPEDAEVRRGESGVWIKVSRFFSSTGAAPAKSTVSISKGSNKDGWASIDDVDFVVDEVEVAKPSAPAPREDWYYKVLNQEIGPVSLDQLLEQCQRGMIGKHDLVRQDGHTDWMQASLILKLAPAIAAAANVKVESSTGFLSPQRGMPAKPKQAKQTKPASAPTIAAVKTPQIERPTSVPKGDTQVPRSSRQQHLENEPVSPPPPQATPVTPAPAYTPPPEPPRPSMDYSPPRPAYRPPVQARASSKSSASMSLDIPPKYIYGAVVAVLLAGIGYWFSAGAMQGNQDRELIENYTAIYQIVANIETDSELAVELEERVKPRINHLKKSLEEQFNKSRPIVKMLTESVQQDFPSLLNSKKLTEVRPAQKKMSEVVQKISAKSNS
ncbi:GYF domain-containing protein [Planctomicrobium piriforme]|uniref:GYF domain-containing protein n=1 Tax=Planctomicrobium piriforme TaxID=1576369 RepID=A0A1I3IDW4_9PLAN|nr:GYF domain-containing protein [Planctomicrobium piriforme]SFI46158.1 protein of unknown function [Planctomicrobium piriforme]